MGRLAVTEFVSIDGVFEDPGGAEEYEHGGWTFEYDPRSRRRTISSSTS